MKPRKNNMKNRVIKQSQEFLSKKYRKKKPQKIH